MSHFLVMYVGKDGGHFHDVRHVDVTLGIGPSIDKGNAIVGRE